MREKRSELNPLIFFWYSFIYKTGTDMDTQTKEHDNRSRAGKQQGKNWANRIKTKTENRQLRHGTDWGFPCDCVFQS